MDTGRVHVIQHRRAVAALAVFGLLVTACGSRLTDEQREFALAGGGGGGGAGLGVGGPIAGGDLEGDPVDGGDLGLPGDGGAEVGPGGGGEGGASGEGAGDGAGGGAEGGGEGGGGGGGARDTRAAPPGGNGGATDRGVTEDRIVIANVADVSGPVPGLFRDAQLAVAAYVAYFTATEGTVYGRRIELLALDSRMDSGQGRAHYLRACQDAFAGVGSMSAFEEGAAPPINDCRIPDLRTAATSAPLQTARTVYSGEVQALGQVNGSAFRRWAEQHPGAVKKSAYLWIENATTNFQTGQNRRALETIGYEWLIEQPIAIAETSYDGFALDMARAGVEFVTFQGDYTQAIRLAQAMASQGVEPVVYALQPNVYSQRLIQAGGSDVEGIQIYASATPLEEIERLDEMKLYRDWLRQVDPRATPTYLGMYAWSMAKLFVEGVKEVGPELTRAEFLEFMDGVTGWDGNGLHAPQDIGPKRMKDCHLILQVQGGKFVRTWPDRGWTCRDAPLRVP